MNTRDFTFDLPEELIAQFPSSERGKDRLMLLDRSCGDLSRCTKDYLMEDLPDLIDEGTLMVFNDSKVRRARIFGNAKDSGAKCQFLLLKNLGENRWLAMVNHAKRQRPGKEYFFPGNVTGKITGIENQYRIIEFSSLIDDDWLEKYGHIPLPPYIKREDVSFDGERYQTVYAREVGSVAAPTAGLHFTREILNRLAEKNIETAWVTLHVGLGTFLPVRTERIEDHVMHREVYSVPERTASVVTEAKKSGRPVLAVGTTSIRTLESAWDETGGCLRSGEDSTGIFIYPGYKFKVVDQVFTNFHTPESTLLMLVSAFAGREKILTAYKTAVEKKYRFFSYGDGMLIK